MSINQLYTNARAAFNNWSVLTVQERLAYLAKLRLVIIDQLDYLANTISEATGKVEVEAITTELLTVLDSITFLEKHAVASLAKQKVKTPIMFFGKKSYIYYQPRGVVLVISPWNFPFQLSLIPALNAVISGNSVIIKPSEVTPQVGIVMEEILSQAGFPEHVIQIAHGDYRVGQELVAGKPDFIFFTGSVAIGKKIQMEAAKHLIPTILELGGKDSMIVFPDAHLERAVNGALWGAFTNAGQVCMSVERLFVHQSIYPHFVDLLVNRAKQLTDDLGKMTSHRQCEIVQEQVMDALAKGGKMLTGQPPSQWDFSKVLFISPIILTEIKPEMRIWREETFGPVLPIIPFQSAEQAVELTNQLEFGLSASVWTKDLALAERIAGQLVVGNVMINDVITSVANPYLPFGGAKASGLGRYHGIEGLRVFTNQVSVMADSGYKKREVNWYPYQGKYPYFKELIRSYYADKKELLGLLKAFNGLFMGDGS